MTSRFSSSRRLTQAVLGTVGVLGAMVWSGCSSSSDDNRYYCDSAACFECDGCYAACPEDAVIKRGPGLRYDYDYAKCTGCAICFEQCPCHAISMIPDDGTGRGL